MKLWVWLVLLLVALLLAGCLWSSHCIYQGVESMEGFLNRMEAALASEDWQKSRAAYTALWQHWQQVAQRWKIFIDHEDMRDIEISLVDLDTALCQQDVTEAQRELSALRYYTKHVAENERIDLTNIM